MGPEKEHDTAQMLRLRRVIAFYASGGIDIFAGLFLAIIGPALIGDPEINWVLWLAGGIMVITGCGLIYIARRISLSSDDPLPESSQADSISVIERV
jgi:hypothetical protein